MISLTCTHCKQVLKIDDAFAGGVCRCQHCGTIQTVPAHLKDGLSSGAVAAAAGKLKPQKALYQHKSRSGTGATPARGSGLDELAQIVSSSGLSGSGLTRGGLRTGPGGKKVVTTPVETTGAHNKKRLMLIGGAVALVLLTVVIVLSLTGGSDAPPGPVSAGGTSAPGSAVTSTGPSFAGMPIEGNSIVYVIDRGGGTKDVFSDLVEVVLISVESLGVERKFQIVFWDNGTDALAYPALSLASASASNLADAREKLQDAYAFGQSDYKQALTKAFARAPDAVVIATGKAFDLDNAFVSAVESARAGAKVKVYTLAVNGSGGSTAMKDAAQKSGGQSLEVTGSRLREMH